MNWRFWRKKKKADQIINLYEDCCLDLNNLTEEELEYIIFRFSETIKSLAFMTIPQNARHAVLKMFGPIKGDQRITFTITWGCVGNDLLMWLGEFRRKERERELQS